MPKKIVLSLLILVTSFFISEASFAEVIPPITTYVQTPNTPDGNYGWYVSPVKFDLTATDLESGVKEINYRIDSSAWQKVVFSDTLNLAPNPSFEVVGATTSGVDEWDATLVDAETIYSQDTTTYLTGYDTASAKISSTTGVSTMWHGINNRTYFAVSSGYENMTASVYLKTQSLSGSAYFKVYSISDDGLGGEIITQIGQSAVLTGTQNWTRVSLNFIVLPELTTGIYIDIGMEGSGTVWIDGATINSSIQQSTTTVIITSDSENHTFEFYSVDQSGNQEAHSCSGTIINCVTFKQDMTPPGNWHDSGAFRGFFGSDHEVYVYTNVEDPTSGLSVFTDKYQYSVESQEGFGRFSNILSCNSTWQKNGWVILISPPFTPGAKDAYLLTPKTDFCNSNWKICKVVRFYSEDMAGNAATKDFCLNGPWIKVRGEGMVKSNYNIDMLSEPEGDNTDGLIEAVGTNIDFFTSTRGWKITMAQKFSSLSYDDWWAKTTNQTQITNNLTATSGTYYYNGNYNITNQKLPNDYDNSTFNQVVFINGNLTISTDIETHASTAALFIVKGNVNIAKNVNTLEVGIFSDGTIDTAYDISEGQTANTLNLSGVFSADYYLFKRTLQGTNNDTNPSESFIYEPKFLVNLKDFFGKHTVSWRSNQ